jgi:hypothetical protein
VHRRGVFVVHGSEGVARADFAYVGSVSAMAPFWTMSMIFGNCSSSSGRFVMTLVSLTRPRLVLTLADSQCVGEYAGGVYTEEDHVFQLEGQLWGF